jgi:transcription elongation factor Elf1
MSNSNIKCLVCDNLLELPDYVDISDYDGYVICKYCKAVLSIRLKENIK